MTSQYAVVCSAQAVYVWQYAPQGKAASVEDELTRKKDGMERVFHIDDPPSSAADPRFKQRKYVPRIGRCLLR